MCYKNRRKWEGGKQKNKWLEVTRDGMRLFGICKEMVRDEKRKRHV